MPRGVYVRTERHKQINSSGHLGTKHSAETRQKMSQSARGNKSPRTHGLSYHPHYQRWYNMMNRCHWHPARHYGQAGVTVYHGWHDCRAFLDYLDRELGPCPEGYSLDRIDSSGNYEPGNIRWASRSEQNRNRRRWTRSQ